MRLRWRSTGERISPDELPWYNLQDLNAIKPAIENSIALTLALGEKCSSLEGIAWLYNSTDAEAARLFTGNIGNQDFLTDPNAYIQARSLYLAWLFQDPRFESFCRDYINHWEKPRKRDEIQTHPYYWLPRYVELLRNTPPPNEAEVSAFFSG